MSRRPSEAGSSRGGSAGGVSGAADFAGDLTLECGGGAQLHAHSQLLALASPFFRQLMAGANSLAPLASVQVEGSREAWSLILTRLQPSFPRPALTVDSARVILPVAAQYNMHSVVAEVMAFLTDQLPSQLSADPKSSSYVIKWLGLAEQLHLDELRALCLDKIKELTASKQLRQALLVPEPTPKGPNGKAAAPTPTSPRPLTCPYNHNPAVQQCLAWCSHCGIWTCTTAHWPVFQPGRCHKCAQPLGGQAPLSNEPRLLDAVKSLDRGTLESLLVVLLQGGPQVQAQGSPAASQPTTP